MKCSYEFHGCVLQHFRRIKLGLLIVLDCNRGGQVFQHGFPIGHRPLPGLDYPQWTKLVATYLRNLTQ